MFKFKKKNIFTSICLVSTLFVPQIISSCSSNDYSEEKISQEWIDQQYSDFENSNLTIDENQLFIEYFLPLNNLKSQKDIKLNYEVLSKIYNIPFINQEGIIQNFVGNYNKDDNTLEINYQLQQQKSPSSKIIDLLPSNNKTFNKKMKVRTLNQNQVNQINSINNMFNNFNFQISNGIETFDISTPSEVLKNINPLFLKEQSNNDENKYFKNSFDNLKKQIENKNLLDNNWNIVFNINFGLDGKITISFFIENQLAQNISFKIFDNKNIKEFSGFKTNSESQTQIIEIYKKLSVSLNLKTLNNNQVFYQTASSIYDIKTIGELLNKLKNNNQFELPEYFNPSTIHQNLWYELQISSITSNDISGLCNISFTIIDKFTQLPISPTNVSKIMTISEFYPLVKKDNSNDYKNYDYSILNMVSQAYSKLNTIQLKNKTNDIASASNTIQTYSDLINNTNIKDVLSLNEQDQTFEINDINNQNQSMKFKIVENQISFKNGIVNNDVIGIKSLPIILQFEVKKPNKITEWINVLPQEKNSNINVPIYDQFEARTQKQAFIKISGYKPKDFLIADWIYESLKKHSEIKILINKNEFFNIQMQTQKEGMKTLNYLIINEIKKILFKDNQLQENLQKLSLSINNLFEKFNFTFDFPNIPFINSNKNIKTDNVNFILTSKNDENAKFELDNYPQITFVISFV